MDMLKTLVLVDLNNISMSFKNIGRKPDLQKLKGFLCPLNEGRFCVDMHIYTTLPHQNPERVQGFHDYLRSNGMIVNTRRAKKLPGGKIKADVDDLLILDAMEMAHHIKPDIIILVTGDGDFSELALRLRRAGIRVEAASLESSLANELKRAVNGVIDLNGFANQCPAIRGGQAVQLGDSAIFDSAIAF